PGRPHRHHARRRPRGGLGVRDARGGRPRPDRRPGCNRRRGRDRGGREAARCEARRPAARRAEADPGSGRRAARIDGEPVRRLPLRPRRRLRRGAAEVSLLETVELADGDLDVDVLPARGLDLGTARFRGERFSWESPLGHIPWQGDFARSFGGGLLVTCGLRNVGLPSEGQPQHGWYSSLAAREVTIGADTATGTVVDAEVPGPTLVLNRRVSLDGSTIL